MRSIPLPAKTVEVSYGQFSCPHCGRLTTYKHKERVKRRAFLFITFLGDTIGEYIECQGCRNRFTLDVLRTGLSTDIQGIIASLKEKLSSGLSIEEVQENLLGSGIDLPTVKRYVSVAAGILHKRCPRCNLRFIDDVHKCHKCGHLLPSQPASQ